MNRQLDELIDQYCAGCISKEELETLQDLLRSSAEYRRHYHEILSVHADLHECIDTQSNGDNGIPNQTQSFGEQLSRHTTGDANHSATPWIRNIAPQAWMAVASLSSIAATFLAVVVWQQSVTLDRQVQLKVTPPEVNSTPTVRVVQAPDSIVVPTATGSRRKDSLAILQQAVEPVWVDGTNVPRIGDELASQTLELDAGIVHLAFFNGATAILEGPARLDLISNQRGVLHFGKIHCFVPDSAQGFTIETATNRFVDLGTEFGLDVGRDGLQELHVFNGEVELQSLEETSEPQRILGGNAIARGMNDIQWSSVETQPTRFTSIAKMQGMKEQSDRRRVEQWQSRMENLLEDPDLLVLYDFEPDPNEPGRLTNRKSNSIHGTILGCEWAPGRWSGKLALDFKRPNNRVRFNLPGTYRNLTMSTWLRVDGFDRVFSSIMSSDFFDNHHLHWQLKSNGSIGSGIKPPTTLRLIYNTPRLLGYEDLGRWVHLALVVDQDDGTMTHYLNGEIATRLPMDTGSEPNRIDALGSGPWPLRIGKAELGNWSPAEDYDEWLVRNLNGRIDEFAVFARALTADEIEFAYQSGKPID
ncbi:LamG domain-containing protein [Rhodopirellula sp. JC740]|uniref:LamG domain-containing protein n=1 Tax=Rhodopirellula halodulae TaxID=2894198 RepID=A0ABS8NDX3_9BACT|nr:LamG domain-containing protein [Rhodopirellula sp. JC740]MCC9641755.1 LamG domain-containing protein [Rhodopirellula sp. JC740]